jgi:hypothetical protein
LKQLDPRVRLFWEQLKSRRGNLPKRKGGRPSSSHQQLLIAAEIRERITANGGRRGSVAKAIHLSATANAFRYSTDRNNKGYSLQPRSGMAADGECGIS